MMFQWITDNMGSIITVLLLTGLVALSAGILIRDKKRGRSSCGCGCGSCPMAGACHKNGRG